MQTTMPIPDNLLAYRYEIVQTDTNHLSWIIGLTLVMLVIYLFSRQPEKHWWCGLNPVIGLMITGLLIRMEVLIHRMGMFLKAVGDPRELFKASDHTAGLMMAGDTCLLLLPLVLIALSMKDFCGYLENQNQRRSAWFYVLAIIACYAPAFYFLASAVTFATSH